MIDNLTVGEVRANRVAWVQALRSKEYEQDRGTLRRAAIARDQVPGTETGTEVIPTKDGYCCLGVGHDIVGGLWQGGDRLMTDPQNPIISVSGKLPSTTVEQLGLSIFDHECLIQMNDDFGFTFDQIADVIETADRTHPDTETPGSIATIFDYLREIYVSGL